MLARRTLQGDGELSDVVRRIAVTVPTDDIANSVSTRISERA